MCFVQENRQSSKIPPPAEVQWEGLDKSKFFFLGAALFSGVSFTLYPIIVLKTRLQVSPNGASCFQTAFAILRHEGPRGFYRGFGTSLVGTIPARALYMGALEVTKSAAVSAAVNLGFSASATATISNAVAGLSSATAAQLVWTPVDVVSQRLMVQGAAIPTAAISRYNGGVDAVRKIVSTEGVRGLYKGFGFSILTYAPSNAVWWASYSAMQRLIWSEIGGVRDGGGRSIDVAVQGVSAVAASGLAALATMPLDTIKTRMQVLEGVGNGVSQTVKSLWTEGGIRACYRGLGPRWASQSLSAVTMATTYEFLKRLSAKNHDSRQMIPASASASTIGSVKHM
ncbi:uncharacterized protein LOC127813414 [Diospyros lotus]|uniref:uncharacterized protein LOC127813414 n=1 Tax=Diospyros lotus TaxID=55363 RepID=UPI00224D8965|nr:uncharacterized protein LOC127813414 [Diospyros lotus]